MKKQTGKQTQSSRVVEAQSESHSPPQRIEREGSPSREQRPKPNGKKRFSTYYGYRSGKAGNRRPIPIMSRKSLVSGYYQLKCGYAPRHISSGSGSEMMISAGGAERRPRRGSISSATARSGRTSGGSCGKKSGEKPAGKLEDVGTCKYRSCCPWRCVIKR